jgi:alpha-1,2-mannosyltransferase
MSKSNRSATALHTVGAERRADQRLRFSDGRVAAINHSLIVWPVLVSVWLFVSYYSAHQFAVDFQHDFWVAGFRVLHSLSPYDYTRHQIMAGVSFPYPATGALMFVPFSLLPAGVSALIFVGMLLTACVSALYMLNVRDWRIYTLIFLWGPVISAWQTANVTLLLVCGTAAVWRYRNSPVVAAVLTGLMLSVKPVVWPLLLWLLITRRVRAAAYGLALALALNAVSWAALGFGQLAAWWHLLALQTDVLYRQGYGLPALAGHFGAGRSAGTVLQFVVTGALVMGCLSLGRRYREREALTLAVAAMFASSPLVDNHYFALLMVPLALARPYLSRAWLVVLFALWLCPVTGAAGWQVILAWVILGAVTAWLVRENAMLPETGIAAGRHLSSDGNVPDGAPAIPSQRR